MSPSLEPPSSAATKTMTFPSIDDPSHLYFITASIVGWKRLFAKAEYARVPLDSFAFLQDQKRIILFAFVIMPSHLHAIIRPEGNRIGEILQEFGSFTAHEIMKKLRRDHEEALLQLFHEKRRDARHEHSIWQDIQAKNIYSDQFLWQKMEYVHQNPIAKTWHLARDRADYAYSSAGFYDYGRRPLIDVTDIRDWLVVNPFAVDSEGSAGRVTER
jgi:REP-associated tyrosine transposase